MISEVSTFVFCTIIYHWYPQGVLVSGIRGVHIVWFRCIAQFVHTYFYTAHAHAGITLQRTQTCEDELRGSIQRKMRSMSLSSLSRRKMRQKQAEAGKMAAIDGPVVAAADGGISDKEFKGLDISPMIARKAAGKGSKPVRSNSILQKFGSLRLSKKKPYCE